MVTGSDSVSLWAMGHSEPGPGITMAALFAVKSKLTVSDPEVVGSSVSM